MKYRITLWFTSVLACLLLTACVNGVAPEVRVNQNHSGQSMAIHRGQELIIELPRGVDPAYAWVVTHQGSEVFASPTKQVIQLENPSVFIERYIFPTLYLGGDQIRIDELRVDRTEAAPMREFLLNVEVVK